MVKYSTLIKKITNDDVLEGDEYKKVKALKHRKPNAMNKYFMETERIKHTTFNDKYFESIEEKVHVLAILEQIKR